MASEGANVKISINVRGAPQKAVKYITIAQVAFLTFDLIYHLYVLVDLHADKKNRVK